MHLASQSDNLADDNQLLFCSATWTGYACLTLHASICAYSGHLLPIRNNCIMLRQVFGISTVAPRLVPRGTSSRGLHPEKTVLWRYLIVTSGLAIRCLNKVYINHSRDTCIQLVLRFVFLPRQHPPLGRPREACSNRWRLTYSISSLEMIFIR